MYYHQTEVSKRHVPSCFKDHPSIPFYCMGENSHYGEELSVLASQGYIVVMPDYIGQGYDVRVLHPYILYPEVNALSGLNMLTATKTLFKAHYNGKDLPKNLFLMGFSEGASYALWGSKLLQTTSANILQKNGLELKKTIGMSGAYDLKTAQLPMEVEDVAPDKDNNRYKVVNRKNAHHAKPILIANALTSYGFYDLDQNYNTLMKDSFFNCVACRVIGQSFTLVNLFNNKDLEDWHIKYYIGLAASQAGYPMLDENANNSATPLIIDNLLDENSTFSKKLVAASIDKWKSNSPIALIYLANDSVVTNLSSTNTLKRINFLSSINTVDSSVIDNTHFYCINKVINSKGEETTNGEEVIIDHQQSEPYSIVAALTKLD